MKDVIIPKHTALKCCSLNERHEMDDHTNDFSAGEIAKFREYSVKIFRLVYHDTEEYQRELQAILDELNALEYSLKFVREEVRPMTLRAIIKRNKEVFESPKAGYKI